MFGPRASKARIHPTAAGALLALLALADGGCTTVQQGGPQQTALMAATKTEVTARTVRALDDVLAISVPGTIETAANSVLRETSDPATRRRALRWKIEVIPAFYQALFYADPLAALLDAWALSIQLEQLLETSAAKEELGAVQPNALAAARRIQQQIATGAKDLAKSPEGFERARSTVERWAQAHPIAGPLSSRPSILPELTEKAGAIDVSVFEVVAGLPATLADVATRMDVYAAYLPKAAHWHAEILADEIADRAEVQRIEATVASVDRMTERINDLLAPSALRGALDTFRGELHSERQAVFASIDQQRLETLAYVKQERLAVVADVDRERLALRSDVDELRKSVLADLDDLAMRVIRRAAVAAAILLVLASALALGVVRLAARSRHRPEHS